MEHDLTFQWLAGSASDNMIRVFCEKGIRYEYRDFRLCACIGPGSASVAVEYYKINGSLFGITQRPMRTTEYFRLPPETLLADRADGRTMEECLLCDNNPDAHPFCDTLLAALEKAGHYSAAGCRDVRILERINNKYGVVAYG